MTKSLKEKIAKLECSAKDVNCKRDCKGKEEKLTCDFAEVFVEEVLAAIDEAIEEIESIDNYPEDVFLPLTKNKLQAIVSLLEENGVSVDGYSAHLMRIAQNNMKDIVLKLLTEKEVK